MIADPGALAAYRGPQLWDPTADAPAWLENETAEERETREFLDALEQLEPPQ